jgi:cell wall-associated NlpC family hydrolase
MSNFAGAEANIIRDFNDFKQHPNNPDDMKNVFKELNLLQSQDNSPQAFNQDLVQLNKDLHKIFPNLTIVEDAQATATDGFKIEPTQPSPLPTNDVTPPAPSPSPAASSSDGGNGSGGGSGSDGGTSGGGGGSSGGDSGGGDSSDGGGGASSDASPSIDGSLPAPIDNGNEIETPSDPKVAQLESSLGNDTGSKAVKDELSQLGTPYVYGAETAGQAFDCSGLTDWAYDKAEGGSPQPGVRGQSIGKTAAAQEAFCQQKGTMITDMSQLKPGDLLFYNEGKSTPQHVAMYAGQGMMVEAPDTGERVRLVPMRQPTAAGRPTK